MIDRKARDQLADLLARYIRGEASEGDVEEFIVPLETDDAAVTEIAARSTWFARDATGAPLLGHPRVQRRLRIVERFILFLRTDMEYQWERVRLPLWTLALAPVALAMLILLMLVAFMVAEPIASAFARVGISIDPTGVFLVCSVILPIAAILLLQRLLGVDGRYWPFYRRRDYIEALDRDPWTPHSAQG